MSNNWFIDYHHAQLLRLLGFIIVFGGVWPVLCLVIEGAFRLTRHVARAGQAMRFRYRIHAPPVRGQS